MPGLKQMFLEVILISMNKKILIAVFLVLVFLFLAFAYFFFTGSREEGNGVKPTPIPVPTDFSIDYSKLYLLKPGKSTLKDVKNINGEPFSTSTTGDFLVLYYNTPSPEYQNVVVLKNDIVYYALENVFDVYRGGFEEHVAKYGQPDFISYQKDYPFPWYVFLKSGVAIASGSRINTVGFLYFVPQNQNSFLNTVGRFFGFSLNPPVEPVESAETTPAP